MVRKYEHILANYSSTHYHDRHIPQALRVSSVNKREYFKYLLCFQPITSSARMLFIPQVGMQSSKGKQQRNLFEIRLFIWPHDQICLEK